MGYHHGDSFTTPETEARVNFYGVTGYPTCWWDGLTTSLGGNPDPWDKDMYTWFRGNFNLRKKISPSLSIGLSGDYDSTTNQGTVTARITNTSGTTKDGTVHFVINETNIPFQWKTLDSLWDVVRDMLPDANGEAISLLPDSSVDLSRDFTIASGWKEENCDIIVFVQKQSTTVPAMIYQAAKERSTELKPLVVEEESKPLFVNRIEVSPNPFTKLTTVRYYLTSTQQVEMNIYDVTGTVVAKVANGVGKAGYNQQTINGDNLTPGVYFVSLGTKEKTTVTKLVVVK